MYLSRTRILNLNIFLGQHYTHMQSNATSYSYQSTKLETVWYKCLMSGPLHTASVTTNIDHRFTLHNTEPPKQIQTFKITL